MWQWLVKIIVPWLAKLLVRAAAKEFRDKRGPEFHAKETRWVLWRRVFAPIISRWRNTPGKIDDVGADYIYFQQACYIEDGRLAEMIRSARKHYVGGDCAAGARDIEAALSLIERVPPK